MYHSRDFLVDVGDWFYAEDARIIGSGERLHEDLVERQSLFIFKVDTVQLAVGGGRTFHSLAVLALLGHFVSCDEHFVGAPTVEVAACAAEHGEQGLDNGKVGISRRAVYSVALAYLGDKFAVGAVGICNEPVIHFSHTKHLIHNGLWILLTQFYLFGEQVRPAYVYGVRCWHGIKC